MSEASWAPDAQSIDYRHLGVPLATEPFSFSAAHLQTLCALNQFSVDDHGDVVVFALRGCRVLEPEGTMAASVRLAEDVPDHADFHCTIGVWRRATNEVAAFNASTVPNFQGMKKQRESQARDCNLLLTGRYLYTVGNHRAGSDMEMRGVLVQQPNVVVLRSNDDLTYTTTDVFDACTPGDNLHPSRDWEGEVVFASEGCLTIQGKWHGLDQHTGRWAGFRDCLGLGELDETEKGKPFVVVLLTGREARLVATAAEETATASWRRLRFGSEDFDGSNAVQQLQESLCAGGFYTGPLTGKMDQQTTWALIQRQRAENGGAADGIFALSTEH